MQITKNTLFKDKEGIIKTLRDKEKLAIERALQILRNNVVERTPVVTGRLKGSIQGKARKPKDSIFSIDVENARVVGIIGTNVEYARRVEFGSGENRLYFTRGYNVSVPLMSKTIRKTIKL